MHKYVHTTFYMLYTLSTKAPPGPWEEFIKSLQLQSHDHCTSSCFILLIHRLLVSVDSVGSHTIQFTFMTLNSFTEAFLITLFLSSPFFLELVALNYQSLGLSPVTGWWGVEDSITCAEEEHLNASPASPDIHRVGNRSGIEEMCSNGALHPEVVVERSHGRECHVFITLSLRGFLS